MKLFALLIVLCVSNAYAYNSINLSCENGLYASVTFFEHGVSQAYIELNGRSETVYNGDYELNHIDDDSYQLTYKDANYVCKEIPDNSVSTIPYGGHYRN